MRKLETRKVDRDTLERTAIILGLSSAAAKALADADKHDGPVNFYVHGKTLIVEKIAPLVEVQTTEGAAEVWYPTKTKQNADQTC